MAILTTWQKWVLVVLAVAVAFCAGRFTSPKQVQTKSIQTTVTQSNENKDVQQNVVTDTKQTKLPNGVVITETVTKRQTDTEIQEQENQKSTLSQQTTVTNRPDWRVGVIYNPMIPGFQTTQYGAQVEKRLFGEVYVGAEAKTDKTIGLVLSLGF